MYARVCVGVCVFAFNNSNRTAVLSAIHFMSPRCRQTIFSSNRMNIHWVITGTSNIQQINERLDNRISSWWLRNSFHSLDYMYISIRMVMCRMHADNENSTKVTRENDRLSRVCLLIAQWTGCCCLRFDWAAVPRTDRRAPTVVSLSILLRDQHHRI